MTIANINRYIHYLNESFIQLNAQVSIKSIEKMAMILHSAMENKKRIYHSSKHAFDICKDMNPRQTIAALFHDIVYLQIDNGFPRRASDILSPIINFNEPCITLNAIDKSHFSVKLCADVFGFEAGQKLSIDSGLNEFLSAVIAADLLAPYLNKHDLLAIISIIEATIPFRIANENGQGFIVDLSARIKKVCHDFNLFDSEYAINQYINEVLIEAIMVANRDIGGFAESDHAKFLSSTWELIEESSATIGEMSDYTIQDNRNALLKMESFLGCLKSNQIFNCYANLPNIEQLAQMRFAADQNIIFSCHYLRTQITTIAIIEALALETGGNCHISMLLGDTHSDQGKPDRAENYLPMMPDKESYNVELLHVLERGLGQHAMQDSNFSPLTAFVYRRLGDQNTDLAFAEARKMFNQEISTLAFLKSLDTKLVTSIIQACIKTSASRAPDLTALSSLLNKHH